MEKYRLDKYAYCMQFDVVIPTRGDIHNVLRVLGAIDKQTVMPEHIFLIVDKYFSSEAEWQAFAMQACGIFTKNLTSRLQPISNITHDFIAGKGASYVRNYGVNLAKSEHVYLIDDDNTFTENFFAHSMDEYALLAEKGDVLYSPTIMWRETNRIQSIGIRTFHYVLGWPESMIRGWKTKLLSTLIWPFLRHGRKDEYFYYPKMIGGNSLLGKKRYFKELRFDERMKFVFEDLDLTHRRQRTIGDIVVSKNNLIYHMERDKTKAEQSFIATPQGVYEKTKNRILFVKNNANRWQKILFFGVGLWINTVWFMVFILFMGKQKWKLLGALKRGIKEGFSLQ